MRRNTSELPTNEHSMLAILNPQFELNRFHNLESDAKARFSFFASCPQAAAMSWPNE